MVGPGLPQLLQARGFLVEARVDAVALVLLAGDGAALRLHGLGVVLDAAAHLGGRLRRVLPVELHLVVQCLAFLGQLGKARLGGVDHDLRLRQSFRTPRVVGGLVGVAGDQRLVTPDDVLRALALDGKLALAGFARLALGGGQRRRDDAARGTAAVQLALLAVDAGQDGTVRRQPAAVRVDAGIDAARGTLLAGLRPRRRPTQHSGRQADGRQRIHHESTSGKDHCLQSTPYRAR